MKVLKLVGEFQEANLADTSNIHNPKASSDSHKMEEIGIFTNQIGVKTNWNASVGSHVIGMGGGT